MKDVLRSLCFSALLAAVACVVSPPPDPSMTTPEIIAHYGYPAETHHVTTEDGYILELHRIPHGIAGPGEAERPVVLLNHCLLCSSADYVMNVPEKALAYMLADAGYDVWMNNFRGNTYSKNHESMSSSNFNFWKFSWDEMGQYDLPATIDYALNATGQPALRVVGFSMGTTTTMVLLSEKPEYNQKIISAALMAPVAYCEGFRGIVALVAPYAEKIDSVATLLRKGEILASGNRTDALAGHICDVNSELFFVCKDILFAVAGPDPDLLNEEWLDFIISHTPAGSSVHTINHYTQLNQAGGFRKYDYGHRGNKQHYGQEVPPDFNLGNVQVPTALFWGDNDYLAAPEDVRRLSEELPNVQLNMRVPWDKFNHMDFLWATEAYNLLYPDVLDFLKKY